MLRRIAHDDRAQLLTIPRSEYDRIESGDLREVGNILTVDRVIARQLRQDEIVNFELEQPKPFESIGEERREPIGVRLRNARDADMLKVHAVPPCERRRSTGHSFEDGERSTWNDLDVVDVARRPGQAVADCEDEPAETVQLDPARQSPIDIGEEVPPRRTELRRRAGGKPRSSQ